uniref:Laminin subunit gamma-1 n=1 Tax=Clastoptera arizonana TaxID=38151 RepID=A0A1B6D2A0_9HEMI
MMFELFSFVILIFTVAADKWDGLTPWYSDSSCNCNGFSNRCYFDQSLYDSTGHGGHCLDCTGNRDGPNCERCRDDYYQTDSSYCIACNCNETGSRSLQCNSEGKCQCKPGVTGEKCDRCDVNYYDFSPQGCKPCDCYLPGSFQNEPSCDPYSGVCVCKENVEGQRCRGCKPGFFNLDEFNEFGCTPCFCYGHSSVCRSAPGYSKVLIESMFARNNERWHGEDLQSHDIPMQYNGLTQTISLSAPGREAIYFLAPDRFLGDQRASYNRDLVFKLRIGDSGIVPSIKDVVLEGAGKDIAQTIFGQGNPLPSVQTQEYKFRLHENSDYGWQPRLSARDFISILSNLTAIKIRGTYTLQGVGFIDDVRLETARRGAAGAPATWIEMCTCPQGYVGQFCESCAPGYRHDPVSGGPFAPCVPCNCHGHAEICDADTGRCICQHNTAGDNCERCARGFYGNSLQGTLYDCKRCPCPNQGPCMEIGDVNNTIMCLECPKGYTGPHCDICSDGYFGDPRGIHGSVQLCQPCDCNLNVDLNAVGNCNRTTGQCLKCIYNTGGFQCDQCLPGFYGDALALPKGDCKPCQCYYAGTQETKLDHTGPSVCDQLSGQCQCKPHVFGTNCDQCEPGYFNIISGKGCDPCNCDPVGSLNTSCDVLSGQCKCQPGVSGQRCDVCEAYFYGFSYSGCKHCDCDAIGSSALQCDSSGQCHCLDNVEGRRCDRCKENKYDRQKGCVDCPACYNLIQDAVDKHRANLNELNKVLKNIADNPTVISDSEFEENLLKVTASVDQLWKEALAGAKGETDTSLTATLIDLNNQLDLVTKLVSNATKWIENAAELTSQAQKNATQAEDTQAEARRVLQIALDYLQTDGATALQNALKRSAAFGQQSNQMSQIAREARLLAKKHEENASEIKALAENALNLSTQAYNLGYQVVTTQVKMGTELMGLKSHLRDMESKLNHTKDSVNMTSKSVRGVYDEALSLYTEIHALNIPDINTGSIKENALETGNKAKKVIDEANNLLGINQDKLISTNKLINDSEIILQQGKRQQQIADELLANADAAYAKAEEAVKLGNKTLQEAQQTYNTLLKFDNQVQESKDKAAQALSTTSDIKKLIEEAKVKTVNAQQALAGAENDAELARDTAKDAQQKYADQASQEADKILRNAERTKGEAGKLRDEAEVLAGRIATTASKVMQLGNQAIKDQEVVNDAKLKVGQAKTSSSDASLQVEKALEDVKSIIKELNELADIDVDNLNDIEIRLREAENNFYDIKLDEELQSLTKIRIQQSQLVKNYQEELARLRTDVDNIEDINDALPVGCWKRTRLEP